MIAQLNIAENPNKERFHKIRDCPHNERIVDLQALSCNLKVNQERSIMVISEDEIEHFEKATNVPFMPNPFTKPFIGWEGWLSEEGKIVSIRPVFLTE